MHMLRRIVSLSIASLLAASLPVHAQTDSYPSKPIRLVVGFPPGGPTDIVARLIAQDLGKELKQTIVVENKGGAGGIIGAALVAQSKPDGYTLLLSVESSQTRGLALNPTLSYDQEKDFTFIRKVARQRNLLLVNANSPIRSVKDLLTYDKAHPGELNCAGTFGASSHIGCTLFNMRNGTKFTFVNYSGGSAPIADLMAGNVQLGIFTESTVAPQIASGKLRALAIASSERSPAFPDLPTVQEAGAQPLEISPWFGIVGPAGLPADITRKLGDALDKVVASKEFVAQLETIGAVPVRDSTPDLFKREVGEEIVFWNKWAKDVQGQLAR